MARLVQTGLRLPADMNDELRAFCERTGRSMHDVIRFLVRALFEGGHAAAEARIVRTLFGRESWPVGRDEIQAIAPKLPTVREQAAARARVLLEAAG